MLDSRSCFLMRCVPPWRRAYFLLFAQKKVAKEKGTPGSVPATPVPCATRVVGRLAKLAFGSDNASRLPQTTLRCSAPLKGTPKASRLDQQPEKQAVAVDAEKGSKTKISSFAPALIVTTPISAPDGFPGPLRGAEQRRRAGGSRLALFEPQASSCEPPGTTSSAGNRRSRRRPRGRLFFGYFLLAKQKKVRPPPRRNRARPKVRPRQARRPTLQKSPPPPKANETTSLLHQ